MTRIMALLTALLTLAACVTTVEPRVAVPENLKSTLNVSKIDVTTINGVSQTVANKLADAVREELNKRQTGPTLVDLNLQVTKFNVVSGGMRFFTGAFSGSNTMNVTVRVFDPDNTQLADFDVRREANPGGYGAFYDQEAATIRATAEGIVETLYAKQ